MSHWTRATVTAASQLTEKISQTEKFYMPVAGIQPTYKFTEAQ